MSDLLNIGFAGVSLVVQLAPIMGKQNELGGTLLTGITTCLAQWFHKIGQLDIRVIEKSPRGLSSGSCLALARQ